MPRRGGQSGRWEVKRKRRKKLLLDANKKNSRRAKLKNRRQDFGLFEE